MKYQLASIGVLAALFGKTQSIQLTETGYESEHVEVLAQNGNHIEMGLKIGSGSQTANKQKAKVMTEQKAEAQANAKLANKLAPDVYGPNGDNYGNNNAAYDFSRIKIDIHEPGTGEKCKEGEWASAHWVANLMQDGRVYSDTAQEGDGRPKLFTLGGH